MFVCVCDAQTLIPLLLLPAPLYPLRPSYHLLHVGPVSRAQATCLGLCSRGCNPYGPNRTRLGGPSHPVPLPPATSFRLNLDFAVLRTLLLLLLPTLPLTLTSHSQSFSYSYFPRSFSLFLDLAQRANARLFLIVALVAELYEKNRRGGAF